MGLPVEINPLFVSSTGGYQVGRSLRFRSSASASLSRTPSVTSNQRTWTWSGWVKRGKLSDGGAFFCSYYGTSGRYTLIHFNASDQLRITGGVYSTSATTTSIDLASTAVYRDPSAWYHIVIAMDSTQATASNRTRMYVNGVEITSFSSSTYPALNDQSFMNVNTTTGYYGRYDGSTLFFDGYVAETNFIDGQQLTPTSFGAYDTNGVWQPAKYTGTYGTNGFYLPFSNTTSTTTLVQDSSGNGNNWTPNNISLTAGTTYDSMIDSPTVGAGASNYAVLNPLDKGGDDTIIDGNLAMYTPTAGGSAFVVRSSIAIPSTGKWYWEGASAALNGNPANNAMLGIIAQSSALTSYLGSTATGYGYYASNGNKYNSGTATAYGAAYTSTDTIGIAFDADAGTLTFYKNNTSQGTAFTGLTSGPYFAAVGNGGSGAYINFGQRPFTYTPPTGYSALNTYNLPAATIKNGAAYMAATTYTGTGAAQTITNGGNNPLGTTFQPDWVWVKSRSNVLNNIVYDSNRGAKLRLFTNTTDAEATTNQGVTAFNSNGFDIGTLGDVNTNAATFVAWQWQAGKGTTSSNTSGSITSTVSVNATAGFSIVRFTGNAVNGATVGHGLGVIPAMLFIKNRTTGTTSWIGWHKSISQAIQTSTTFQLTGYTGAIYLNLTNGSSIYGFDQQINGNGDSFVAYCWSEIAGYSKFGSYTGNGSTDGPFVYTGFRPRFLLVKRTDTVESWNIVDTSRNTYNQAGANLYPDLTNAESNNNLCDILSNGFKLRNTWTGANASGGTYIYAAFAENPFNSSRAR